MKARHVARESKNKSGAEPTAGSSASVRSARQEHTRLRACRWECRVWACWGRQKGSPGRQKGAHAEPCAVNKQGSRSRGALCTAAPSLRHPWGSGRRRLAPAQRAAARARPWPAPGCLASPAPRGPRPRPPCSVAGPPGAPAAATPCRCLGEAAPARRSRRVQVGSASSGCSAGREAEEGRLRVPLRGAQSQRCACRSARRRARAPGAPAPGPRPLAPQRRWAAPRRGAAQGERLRAPGLAGSPPPPLALAPLWPPPRPPGALGKISAAGLGRLHQRLGRRGRLGQRPAPRGAT